MNNDYVIHMFCFDPRQITDKTYQGDFIKCEKYRLKFLLETIENLHLSLSKKNRFEKKEIFLSTMSIFCSLVVF